MAWTAESAYSNFVDVAGNTFEYLKGPKAGQMARAAKYEISIDKTKLYYVMSDGNKIDSTQFDDIMLMVGDGGGKKDFSILNSTGGNIEADKSNNDVLAQQLGLMSEEEEEAENERRRQVQQMHNDAMAGRPVNDPGAIPSQPQQLPQSASPSQVEQSKEDKYGDLYPIFALLEKRKKKPTVTIPVEIELDFIDKNTYTLIEATLGNGLEGVSKYFIEQVDIEKLHQSFVDSLKKYMVDNFDAEEETVEEEPETQETPELVKEEPKPQPESVGGGPVITKKSVESKNEVVEDEVTPSEKK